MNPSIWLLLMLATLGLSVFGLVVFGGPLVVAFFERLWAKYARWAGG